VPWRYLGASANFAAIALLTAVVGLLLLDRLLFDTPLVAPHLPVDDDSRPGDKLLLAARYRDARLLYLGDSRVLFGVNPAVVSETCRCGPGYNAAFPAADTRLTRIMAERVLRTLSPEVVVIGVSQWELSDAADIHVRQPARELVPPWRWAEFGANVEGSAEQLDATLNSLWRVYRYRGELRTALDPSAKRAQPDDRRRGFKVYRENRRLREEHLDQRERQWFTNFSVRGHRAEALRGLLADLRARGIRVILVAPPLYPNLHTRVRRQVDQFRTAIGELAAENGAVFEDFTSPQRIGATPAHFLDVVHLNESGAERLSHALGRVIKARLDAG
jgi:hypothetical protein